MRESNSRPAPGSPWLRSCGWCAAIEPVKGLPTSRTPRACLSELECALCLIGWEPGDEPIWHRSSFGTLGELWGELLRHLALEHGVRPEPAECPDGIHNGL